jgi:predicted site-specific integrase-resolvase
MKTYTAREATEITGVKAMRFLDFQDRGLITPVIENGTACYTLEGLRKLAELKQLALSPRPVYPSAEYVRASEAMDILDVSRRTFYKRVNLGQIELHKKGRLSYVKKADLYASDELF